MIQFTTISGMYNPNASLTAGTYPCNKNCTIVTRDAITTIYPGIRTRSGMTFLNAEMIMLENINTAVVESPIPAPLIADVVTANVGHIPNIKTKVGFSFTIPLINRSIGFGFMFNYLPSGSLNMQHSC